MKGYPRCIAHRRDFENLLSDPVYADRARAHLTEIAAIDDETATRVVSGSEENGDLVTEEIPNPLPAWKRLGFSSRDEVLALAGGAQ